MEPTSRQVRPPAALSALLVAALVALAALASAAHAQGASPVTWRALYQGSLGPAGPGAELVTLDLTLADDGFAFARLTRAGSNETLDGVGTSDPASGALELTFHRSERPHAAAAAIAYAYYAARDPAAEAGGAEPAAREPAATLTGTRVIDWRADGDELTAVLTLSGGEALAGTLERGAQYAFGRLTQGRIDVGFAYPRFLDGSSDLNNLLEEGARARLGEFLAEGRGLVERNEGLGWGWSHEEVVDLWGAAGAYRSLLRSFYTYTGGAHPNSFSESLLVAPDGAQLHLVQLRELFEPGSGWLARLNEFVLADLRAQEAAWVVAGEVAAVSEADLQAFVLGPGGLTFYFDPYAMGPYVQGGFTATVPYAELLPLAAPGGAVEAFAERYAPQR